MNIAICSDQYLPLLSGIADSIELLAHSLRERGHAVRIYTARFPGATPDQHIFHFPAYVKRGSGGAGVVAFPVGGIRDMRAFKPDVIHVHMFGVVGLFALFAARRLKVPLVGTDHTSPADYLHYFKIDFKPVRFAVRSFASWFYGHAHVVTAPSQHILDELYDYGLKTDHSEVISNAVCSDIFRPLPNKKELKKKYGVVEKAVFLFGRIAKEKNLDFAADVFVEVGRRAAAQLVVLGGGPYEEQLKQKVKALGMEDRTLFLGVLRGGPLVEALNCADVVLVTSTSEIQPMATLQAMAVGLPVVAARAGGLPEVVIDGDTGYIVNPTDKKTYVEKITELLNDNLLRERFGEAARRSVEVYSPSETARSFLAAYQKAITLSAK